jgi:hypothetical protein
MPVIPGPVDEQGNITVPAAGGVTIPIKEQSPEDPPVQVDISQLPLKFHVYARFDIIPGLDDNDPLGRMLTINGENADQLNVLAHEFQLLDMSDPDVPIPLWSGIIRRGE